MLKLPVYNSEGKESGNVNLDDKSFPTDFNLALVRQVVITLRNNKRTPAAHTKIKSEVRGGGKKPWRQKGTGRARAGSIRSTLWKGGGITFGPRNDRNYFSKINKKEAKIALAMVFKAKAEDKELKVIENLNIEKPKTKELVKLLTNWGSLGQSIMLITAKKEENLKKASGNIPNINIKSAKEVNALDFLNRKLVIIDKIAFELLIKRLS